MSRTWALTPTMARFATMPAPILTIKLERFKLVLNEFVNGLSDGRKAVFSYLGMSVHSTDVLVLLFLIVVIHE